MCVVVVGVCLVASVYNELFMFAIVLVVTGVVCDSGYTCLLHVCVRVVWVVCIVGACICTPQLFIKYLCVSNRISVCFACCYIVA